MALAIFEVNEEDLRLLRHEGICNDPMVLSDIDIIAIRFALLESSRHPDDRFGQVLKKIEPLATTALDLLKTHKSSLK